MLATMFAVSQEFQILWGLVTIEVMPHVTRGRFTHDQVVFTHPAVPSLYPEPTITTYKIITALAQPDLFRREILFPDIRHSFMSAS